MRWIQSYGSTGKCVLCPYNFLKNIAMVYKISHDLEQTRVVLQEQQQVVDLFFSTLSDLGNPYFKDYAIRRGETERWGDRTKANILFFFIIIYKKKSVELDQLVCLISICVQKKYPTVEENFVQIGKTESFSIFNFYFIKNFFF